MSFTIPYLTIPIATSTRALLPLLPFNPYTLGSHACHYRRDSLTRQQDRFSRPISAPLSNRSLFAISKRHKEARSRRASWSERWQECEGVKQLCWFVLHIILKVLDDGLTSMRNSAV